jgi:hypothetical protein
MFTRERRVRLRNIAMGRLMGTDKQLEGYVTDFYVKKSELAARAAAAGLDLAPLPGASILADKIRDDEDAEFLSRNRALRLGSNAARDWAMEMVGMAMTNTWHFGVHALRWYIAMHRQALLLAGHAAGEHAAGNGERARALFNAALHYEAHACHSLTDLFAPGHMTVDRWESSKKIYADTLSRHHRKLRLVEPTDLETPLPFAQWQDALWMTTFPLSHQQIMDTKSEYVMGAFDAPPPAVEGAGTRLTTAGLPPLRAVPAALTNEVFEEGSMPYRLSTVTGPLRAKEEKLA